MISSWLVTGHCVSPPPTLRDDQQRTNTALHTNVTVESFSVKYAAGSAVPVMVQSAYTSLVLETQSLLMGSIIRRCQQPWTIYRLWFRITAELEHAILPILRLLHESFPPYTFFCIVLKTLLLEYCYSQNADHWVFISFMCVIKNTACVTGQGFIFWLVSEYGGREEGMSGMCHFTEAVQW